MLRSHLEEPQSLFSEAINFERTARALEKVTRQRSLRPGERLFSVGDPAEECFLVESGTINMQARPYDITPWKPMS